MTSWRIIDWSAEHGRGVIESPQLGRLPFDGHYGNVHDFRIGELVQVELTRTDTGYRVTRISPDDARMRGPVAVPRPAAPLDPRLQESTSAALASLQPALDYRIRSQNEDVLILEGSNDFCHGILHEIVVHGPSYLDLPTHFSPDVLRLATQLERDYLTTRIDDLTDQDVALVVVEKPERFYFVVGARVSVRRHKG